MHNNMLIKKSIEGFIHDNVKKRAKCCISPMITVTVRVYVNSKAVRRLPLPKREEFFSAGIPAAHSI